MLRLVHPGAGVAEQLEDISTLLDEWGEIALRTLVWGKKEMSDEEHATWHEAYTAATSSPEEV